MFRLTMKLKTGAVDLNVIQVIEVYDCFIALSLRSGRISSLRQYYNGPQIRVWAHDRLLKASKIMYEKVIL